MKRSSATSVKLITMSARSSSSSSSYRGRNHFRRGGFSGRRQYSGGRGDEQFVTGDSHFRSVQEANLGIRQSSTPQRPNQHFVPNHHNQFRQSPAFRQNQQPQQFRPRPPKQLNYREWQHSKTAPQSNSEKFIVVSYNILADYLAINHRSKLYFHIPRYMLDWEWRKTSILFELRLWSPDIMCFQEVDNFMDLEEQLKLQGYSGIWKMRTGNAVDGCAIFWRSSRFKLLHEESIQFNKVGLRDNVAQICVLELLGNNSSSNTPPLTASSAGSKKVVLCNIHVLYNPKRGEIKIGQVRILLDMAHAVSKVWNAPIVLCGDFNCTPKSPLYNFISEQKLDLSGVDRDKVSGQASAEIRAPGQNNPNYCTKSNLNPNPSSTPVVRNPSSDRSTQAPLIIDNKLENSLSDVQNENIPDENDKNVPSTNDCLNPQVIRSTPAACDISQCGSKDSLRHIEETKETQENVIDSYSRGTESATSALIDSFEENLSISHSESESRLIHMSAPTITSHGAEMYTGKDELEQTNSYCSSNQGFSCGNSQFNVCEENRGPSIDNLAQPHEVMESSGFMSFQQIIADNNTHLSPACQANISSGSTSLYHAGAEKLGASLEETSDCQLEGEMVREDQSTFLSALHDKEEPFQIDCRQSKQSDLAFSHSDYTSNLMDSQTHSPDKEIFDDVSLELDYEAATADNTAYDPSLWTPMEIATATGNADCSVLEHPLKLKSTYTEVEDHSRTRDPNGEPLATSYNRCFLGTVDYIWRSEGLQTTRVLAPIPKHAMMQWTSGFPTKKWGSDHIALACELAFTKDATDNKLEAQ